MRYKQKLIEHIPPHDWFAWYPVRDGLTWIWLEVVTREMMSGNWYYKQKIFRGEE